MKDDELIKTCRSIAKRLSNSLLTEDELVSVAWIACKNVNDPEVIEQTIWRSMREAIRNEQSLSKQTKRKIKYNNSLTEGYEEPEQEDLSLLNRLKDFKFQLGYGSTLRGHELTIFCLVEINKESVSKISKDFNVSRQTIYNLVNKIKSKLRNAVSKQNER